MATIELAGNGLLMMIQQPNSLFFLLSLPDGVSLGHFNPDHGEQKLAEMMKLIQCQIEVEKRGKHSLQGSGKALPGSIPADV